MTAPLLEARNLARTYSVSRGPFRPAGVVHALADASFTLEPGRTLAVVGESGSGKSTLARLVTMIERPSAGSLTIDGIDIARADRATLKTLRRDVQIVFQNPYGSLNPRQTIAQQIAEPLEINTDMSAADRRAEAVAMLAKVGLRPEHADRFPHMFSGGQRQRIAIARAVILKPRILVLDEPVSALDVSVRAQVLNLLADLQDELGLAYLFVSHDLSVVRHIADEVLVMYLGRAVEQGDSEAIFSAPKHPYTEALLSATPSADPERVRNRIVLKGELPSPFAPPSGCAFNPRCWKRVERCVAERPPLAEIAGRKAACWVAMAEAGTNSREAAVPA
ncbi:dipeptide transport system ATP-binding protein [Pseudoxanthobacter soli DSM 19599]|uniref:Dipeptide transport system ATP-binding protein n=1 Tax=Pseudoxanthobacter soli DSM 19599 TaxID=1123029 RepID=A0A1M7Z8A6_9HYPH|nr:dipeptide ABC transporter ATP-binding protein [Pseudoxanthobacter soli]SHO61079.1 dipeptide transport system ATP-binding protein [Pseudoxanthobacter soli DSM 19599]